MEYRSVSIDDLRNRTEVPEDKNEDLAIQNSSFEELFEQFQANQDFKMGDIVDGRVVSITKDYVVVDIGYKAEGQIPVANSRTTKAYLPSPLVTRLKFFRPSRRRRRCACRTLQRIRLSAFGFGTKSASLASVMNWLRGVSSLELRVV